MLGNNLNLKSGKIFNNYKSLPPTSPQLKKKQHREACLKYSWYFLSFFYSFVVSIMFVYLSVQNADDVELLAIYYGISAFVANVPMAIVFADGVGDFFKRFTYRDPFYYLAAFLGFCFGSFTSLMGFSLGEDSARKIGFIKKNHFETPAASLMAFNTWSTRVIGTTFLFYMVLLFLFSKKEVRIIKKLQSDFERFGACPEISNLKIDGRGNKLSQLEQLVIQFYGELSRLNFSPRLNRREKTWCITRYILGTMFVLNTQINNPLFIGLGQRGGNDLGKKWFNQYGFGNHKAVAWLSWVANFAFYVYSAWEIPQDNADLVLALKKKTINVRHSRVAQVALWIIYVGVLVFGWGSGNAIGYEMQRSLNSIPSNGTIANAFGTVAEETWFEIPLMTFLFESLKPVLIWMTLISAAICNERGMVRFILNYFLNKKQNVPDQVTTVAEAKQLLAECLKRNDFSVLDFTNEDLEEIANHIENTRNNWHKKTNCCEKLITYCDLITSFTSFTSFRKRQNYQQIGEQDSSCLKCC